MRISLCMIARDEERTLPECLDSVREEVDEIIVVDTGSGDGTVAAARRLGARVYRFRWRDDFAAARNAALDRATGEWILVLDCDERLDPACRGSVRRAAAGGPPDARLVQMVNVRENGVEAERWLAVRLFRKLPGRRYEGRIHERLRLTGRAVPCEVRILHVGYQQAWMEARDKRARNLRLVEAACAETAAGPPDRHSLYLFYRAFGVTGRERDERLAEWVRYVESHPELEKSRACPWIPTGLAHYAWGLSDAGAHAAAEERALRLAERHGESPLLHLILARARAAAGDYDGARRQLARLESGRAAEPYQYFPIDYDLIRRRGRRLGAEIAEREGRLAEAERSYRRLVEEDPADLASALRLVCVLVQMGACRPALDVLEHFPALLEQGLIELDCLGLALALIAQVPETLGFWRDRVLARAGESELAARTLQRVAQQRPGAPFRLADFPELEQGVRLAPN